MRSQARLTAENLVLRQQGLILSRKSPTGVRLRNLDRLVLVWLYRSFPSILNAITVVKPETVIRWHAAASQFIGTGGLDGSVGDHGLIEQSET